MPKQIPTVFVLVSSRKQWKSFVRESVYPNNEEIPGRVLLSGGIKYLYVSEYRDLRGVRANSILVYGTFWSENKEPREIFDLATFNLQEYVTA